MLNEEMGEFADDLGLQMINKKMPNQALKGFECIDKMFKAEVLMNWKQT